MRCSEQVGDPAQVAWYHVRTGKRIDSGKRFELTGLSLKITNVQLNDAGTYECRGVSKRRYLTIYVNGEFFLMHLLPVISASFILLPNYNAILLFLMFRCLEIDFIVKSVSIRSAGIVVDFTGFIKTCPV